MISEVDTTKKMLEAAFRVSESTKAVGPYVPPEIVFNILLSYTALKSTDPIWQNTEDDFIHHMLVNEINE